MLKHWWKCDKLNFLKHLIANLKCYQILSCGVNALKCRQKRPTMTMISNLSSSYKSTHLIISSLLLYVFLSPSLSPGSGLPLRRLRWEKGQWVGDCSDYQLWLLRYDLLFFFSPIKWPDLDKNLSHCNYSFFFSLIILTYIVDTIFPLHIVSWAFHEWLNFLQKKLLIAVWHLLGYTIIYLTWLLVGHLYDVQFVFH